MRIVARDRYVNGHNGEFLCIKGRFGHPFVNHEERIRTPLIRYKEGGRLGPGYLGRSNSLHGRASGQDRRGTRQQLARRPRQPASDQ
jgi:NADH dehydrogenase/NADH:ubiquinone oxidoreductase subunit G